MTFLPKVAADHAVWLAELAATVDASCRLAGQLVAIDSGNAEVEALRARLRAIAHEVEQLRGAGTKPMRQKVDPNWMKNLLERPKSPD